jgi:histidyl-tRNA synthetase
MCRPNFIRAFFDHLRKNEERLCADCKRRMDRNPLRTLDCKQPECQKVAEEGPSIQDYLDENCEKDFDMVLETLGQLGSTYKVNAKIVRGLDYYLKTTFEFTSTALGAQNAVAGGGRYDGLVRLMGGPNVPGFGFAIGLERLVDILKEQKKVVAEPERSGVFLAVLGEKAYPEAMKLAVQLRQEAIPVDLDYEGKSLKSQMRRADKIGCRYVVFLGSEELSKKTVSLRDMVSGGQEDVPLATLMQRIKKT